MQRAVQWYPPRYDIRVEDVPIPSIIDADDAIVKVKLAGLCGSDLHAYRGHEHSDCHFICGHEIIGEIVALGASFHPGAAVVGRPELYSTLKVGDKVVSPFSVSCGECHFCRIGFTSRCTHSRLFGSPALSGGQAQYVRVPKAGGTLFSLASVHPSPPNQRDLSKISDSSLLLLADILPTGAFAAIQVLQHPKVAAILTGKAYPFGGVQVTTTPVVGDQAAVQLQPDDRTLTIAVVGLGPVGVCAVVSLLHLLADLEGSEDARFAYQIIAVDPLETRRVKMEAVYKAIHPQEGTGPRRFMVASIDEAKEASRDWTNGVGCNAVLEVVGNNSALTLAYDIVRPFGVISSVGVHQEPPLPFNGRSVYDKNVSFDFGRCPVRAIFPIALEILLKRQDVFGGIGDEASLIDRIVSLNDASDVYEQFDKGKCGKILFNPWL